MAEEKKSEEKVEEKKASWIKMKPAELEKKVVELAKEGKQPAEVGRILRDQYGIPKTKIFGKRISQILKEQDVEIKTKKEIIEGNIEHLKKHISSNKKDYPASRALTKKLWNLHWAESK